MKTKYKIIEVEKSIIVKYKRFFIGPWRPFEYQMWYKNDRYIYVYKNGYPKGDFYELGSIERVKDFLKHINQKPEYYKGCKIIPILLEEKELVYTVDNQFLNGRDHLVFGSLEECKTQIDSKVHEEEVEI